MFWTVDCSSAPVTKAFSSSKARVDWAGAGTGAAWAGVRIGALGGCGAAAAAGAGAAGATGATGAEGAAAAGVLGAAGAAVLVDAAGFGSALGFVVYSARKPQ